MRKVARVEKYRADVRWVILYESADGVYLFFCKSDEDGSSSEDHWFATVQEAESECAEALGVRSDAWILVDDPLPDCQHDWISPVRKLGRDTASPRWGSFERLSDGKWLEMRPGDARPQIEAAVRDSRRPA